MIESGKKYFWELSHTIVEVQGKNTDFYICKNLDSVDSWIKGETIYAYKDELKEVEVLN